MTTPTKRKVYCPPQAEDIEEAASWLRQRLDRDTEFEDGFSQLLKSIAKAYAHNLTRDNRVEPLDNDIKTA